MRHVVDYQRILLTNRRFHDEVEAHSYDRRMGVRHHEEAVRDAIAELKHVLGAPLPRGRVLDVGAGTGNLAIKLARTGRFQQVVAADISAGMLEVAQREAQRLGCTIDTVQTDMKRLPFDDGTFDLVVGCAVLHHLPDPRSFMAEVRRVLAPGAPFIFIGEPSTVGHRMTEAVKSPLVLTSRVLKRLSGQARSDWKHDDIDVHTFSLADLQVLTHGFERARARPAGFLAPIIGQGLLAPARQVLQHDKVASALTGLQTMLHEADDAWCDRKLPPDWLVSMKFAGYKPGPPTNHA